MGGRYTAARLGRGLTSFAGHIEYGDTDELSRPLFAGFLGDAGGALGGRPSRVLGERHAELGRQRGGLADGAAPAPMATVAEG